MSAIVLALVFVPAVLAVAVFAAVVVGIHSEPRDQMTTTAPSPLAAMVRRLLGVYVAKPTDTDASQRTGGTGDDPPARADVRRAVPRVRLAGHLGHEEGR